MTNEDTAEILYGSEITVLGVGNIILTDEGFGVRAVEFLAANYEFPDNVRLVDGGTLGAELTQYITGTKKLLVIDSINGGKTPGTKFRFEDDAIAEHFQEKLSVHEVGIQDVLALLTLTGKKIPKIVVLGAQPYDVSAGVGLTDGMMRLLPEIVGEALAELAAWGVAYTKKENASAPDFSTVAEAING